MPYPSYSYLDQETLRSALDLARTLRDAAATIDALVYGGAAGGRGDGGRIRSAEDVVQNWIGPTRDTFALLFDNERGSATDASRELAEEADAWARFWATATNARNTRLYDEAIQDYEATLGEYQRQLTTAGPGVGQRPPHPPIRRPPVHPPVGAMDYRPSADG